MIDLKMVSPSLARDLSHLYGSFHYESSLKEDPLSFVRPFAKDRRAAEIMGVFASTVAVGNVQTIRGSLDKLLKRMNGDPRGFVEGFKADHWRDVLYPWQHRWIRADQMSFLALRLREVYSRYNGGLEEVFLEGAQQAGAEPTLQFAGGLDTLSRSLRWGSTNNAPTIYEPPPGYLKLFPSPMSANRPVCKRLTLFVRWMVRQGFPDMGLWRKVSPSILHIPLDTHVYWIAYHMGLTHRRTKTWRTVVEVTEMLRGLDAADPIRFDFALAHTGISGDCPKTRDLRVCGQCALRPDCDLWRPLSRPRTGRAGSRPRSK
jgi:uncharacterized protein (TIGR02757 family)